MTENKCIGIDIYLKLSISNKKKKKNTFFETELKVIHVGCKTYGIPIRHVIIEDMATRINENKILKL